MKNLLTFAPVFALALGLSSCCSMFSRSNGGTTNETKQKLVGYDTTTKTDALDSKSNLAETTKTPRYETVTKTKKVPCFVARKYCIKNDCGNVVSQSTISASSIQGGSGSPNSGLLPTMRSTAP